MNRIFDSRTLTTSIVASIVLCLGTLYIFLRLNATGPAATLRLFHVAIQDHDENLLSRVTDRDTDPAADRLTQVVAGFLSKGAQFKVVDSQGQTNRVIMQVTYTLGNLNAPMIFVMNREGRSWRIDATDSLRLLQQALKSP